MRKDRPKTQRSDSAGGARSGPQRTCAGCRKSLDQDLLVRYVLSPQDEIVVDYRRKLPGRGAYTCLNRSCLELAVKRNQLSRSLRGGKEPSADKLWRALYDQIRGKVLNLLGMSRKAGQVISGTRQVLSELQAAKEFGLLVRADDLSSAIAEKVEKAASCNNVPCIVLFTKEQLGRLLGKSERGVVMLKNGPLTAAIAKELERLDKFSGEL